MVYINSTNEQSFVLKVFFQDLKQFCETMKLILSCFVLFCLLADQTIGQYTKAPNCSIDAFENSFTRAYGHFGVERLSLPSSQKQLKDYCKHVIENRDFSKDYGKRCLTGTAQTLLNLQVYNIDRTNKPYCSKKGSKKEAFVSWTKCGTAAKPETRKCWLAMVEGIGLARKVENVKSRIPVVCCKYYAWIKCMKASWKKNSDCSAAAQEGYAELVHKSTVDSMNLICNRYEDDDDKCGKILKELPNKSVLKKEKLRDTPMSYIFDVFESI